jgi:transcriptional regulator GlxA family with amidase domain
MFVNCFLFDDFESLDLFGPVEAFGNVEDLSIKFYSVKGGIVKNKDHDEIATENISAMEDNNILLIPGGPGTRELVNDAHFISLLKEKADKALWCLSVCTGSALFAKAGLLDDRKATSNKMAFEWVKGNGKKVNWIYSARWVVDEKYYTAAGVSAGIDMSLGFIGDRYGKEKAREIARIMEYDWNEKNFD